MIYLELVAGIVLLVAGGDALVRGAVAVAGRFGVSPLLIGLTLVGFGTSAPELVTSLSAAFAGSPGIAVGNVVGSNIANILLILGVAALIHPMRTAPEAFRRDGTVVLLATLVCVGVVLTGALGRPAGLALVAGLLLYLATTIHQERKVHDASAVMHEAEAGAIGPGPARLHIAILLTLAGMVMMVFGARLLVGGAIELARLAGISETIVGLTVVAIATSLPELVTSVVAAIRRQSDVAFGNIVGSNIFNILGILGITAIIHPIPVPIEIARLDIWVMLAATLAFLLFSTTGWRLDRIEGAAFLAAYGGYIGFLGLTAN